jgi:hypothetical protein
MSDRGRKAGSTGRGSRTSPPSQRRSYRKKLEALVEEERAVSYRRRVLHGSIDLIRAELVKRVTITRPPEELVRVFMGDWRP